LFLTEKDVSKKGETPMTQSPLRNFILGSLMGAVIAASLFTWRQSHALAAEPEPQKPCAPVGAMVDGQPVTQEGYDFAQEAIRTQHAAIERLNAELAQAREGVAAWQSALQVENANLGHCASVLKEAAGTPSALSVATVLYEPGRPSVNISLLPFPGMPRVAIGPHSEMAPRWVIPGKIEPQMVGETRKAIYYYFNAAAVPGAEQWQGPFAPQRVVQ
jgi:hypothetical protein